MSSGARSRWVERFTEDDFNTKIIIKERELSRVREFMDQTDQAPEDARLLRHPGPCCADPGLDQPGKATAPIPTTATG